MTTFPEPDPVDAGTPQQVNEDALLADLETEFEDAAQTMDMTPLDHRRRLVLVHAHPDDETVGTGCTMARYAAAGDLVTLVTCTRGELGEVVDPDQLDLMSTGPDDNRLGEKREDELTVAMEALGVTDHRFLGGPGRWRDSGMIDTPENANPANFWNADFDEATAAVVAVLREVRPQVVITYDANGGYGHPDHIQAHRIAVAGVARANDPAYRPDLGEQWEVSRILATAIPRSLVQAAVDAGVMENLDEVPSTPDEQIAVAIDGTDQFGGKVAAMRAHRTQIDLREGMWAMLVQQPAFAVEHYALISGEPVPGMPADDVFAGLSL